MSVAAEALKIACVVIPIVGTGLFGIDKIIRETDAKIATIRAELDSTARIEMIKKFADDSADPREVFRSIAILLRLGLLADEDGRLAAAVFDYYGTLVGDLSLSELAYRQRREPQPAPAQAGSAPSRGEGTDPRPGQSPEAGQAAASPAVAPGLAPTIAMLAVQIDSSDIQARRAATQRLMELARADAGRARVLLGPLIDQVSEPQILGLSATGRLNTLSVLAEVPANTWAGNPSEAARLRASLDALERRRAAGAVVIGTTTDAVIRRIREALAKA
jgi:hypothetical protein